MSHAIAALESELGVPVPYERVIGVAILSNALHVLAVFAFLDLLKHRDQKPIAT